MFIARSTARIRRARLVFLVAGLAPTVALVAWAIHLRSDAHRAAVESRWQAAIGLPITIGRIEHPTPGVMRAHDCLLPATAGRAAVALPLIEVESSADEDRVRIPRVSCDVSSAAAGMDLAGRWLADGIRFRRACVVEIEQFSFGPSGAEDGHDPGALAAPLRVECVLHDQSRALRIVRRGTTDDEVRIVRHPAPGGEATYEIDASIATPLPLSILAGAADDHHSTVAATGTHAMISGTLQASHDRDGWRGEARGRLVGLDLATAAAAIRDGAKGMATIDVSKLVWQQNRVASALAEVAIGPGHIDRKLFDRIVLALGARPGPAAARVPATEPLVFDTAGGIVAIGPHGVHVQLSPRLPGGLAITKGDLLLGAPVGPVTADRVAWLLSSPGTAFGPTAGPGAWLMSVLPPIVPPTAQPDGERRF